MRKIKIFMLHLGYGGIERQTITMANSLTNDFIVEIISFYKLNNKPAYNIDPKIKIKYLYEGKPNRDEFKGALKKLKLLKIFKEGMKAIKIIWLKFKLIKDEIKEDDADIYFTTREEHAKILSKYGKNSKLKITEEHNFISDSKYRRRIVKEYKNLNYVVVISKYHEKMYKNWFKKTNVKIIRIENILSYRPKNKSKLNNNAVVAAGRFNYIKDFLTLIEVMKNAVKDNPALKLYLLGDGEEKDKIIKKIKENKLEENVIMPGFVGTELVHDYMSKSDIYLMTSKNECFPIVLLESMSLGLPIISFDILTGPREIVKNNKNGYLIPNRDAKLMAYKVNELLKDKNKLKEFGKYGYNQSLNYSIEKIKTKWIKLFSSMEWYYEKSIVYL